MRFTAETRASPDAAFAAIADFTRLAEWDPFVHSVDVDGAPMVVGTQIVLSSVAGLRLRYEVVEVGPGHRVVYRGGSKRGGSTDTITVRPTDRGAVAEVDSRLHFTGWVRPVGPIVGLLVWVGGRFVSLPAMRRRLDALT